MQAQKMDIQRLEERLKESYLDKAKREKEHNVLVDEILLNKVTVFSIQGGFYTLFLNFFVILG